MFHVILQETSRACSFLNFVRSRRYRILKLESVILGVETHYIQEDLLVPAVEQMIMNHPSVDCDGIEKGARNNVSADTKSVSVEVDNLSRRK